MIKAEVKGAEKFRSKLFAFPDRFEERIIQDMSQIAYDSAQRSLRDHVVTGALEQSLENIPVDRGRSVRNDPERAPHAIFVHDGTQAHEIKPNERKALRWAGPDGFIFAGKVNHPGYAGDPYMAKAADEAISQFNKIIDNAFFAEWS